MRTFLFIQILVLLNSVPLYGQSVSDYNLDFENPPLENGMPVKWYRFLGTNNFIVTTDTKIKQQGNTSMKISSDKKSDRYEAVLLEIPIHKQGDTITVKAYMKFENVSNFVGLILRLDAGKNQMIEYYDQMEEGINGTGDWKEYSISLPLSGRVQTVFIGAMLSGKGNLWVDNFSLWIDGKDFREAPPGKTKVIKTHSDTVEFKESSNIILDTLDHQQIKNLDKLGRIWGMMKYFHPAIAQGEYNWDYELFRILPAVINVRTDSLCNLTLINWVHQFRKFDLDTQKQARTEPLKMEADFKWTKNVQLLSRSLISFLDSLRNAEKVEEHYYLDFNWAAGNPLFKNEAAYKDMKYPDPGYRLLSLFRYWNMVQYFFPYKYLIGEDWNLILPEFIPKFIRASSEIEYQKIILELITRINDTHAQINNEGQLALGLSKGLYALPFTVQFIDNQPVIAESINSKLAKESILQRGDILLKINNKKIDELVSEQRNYTPASNEDVRLRNIAYNLIRSQSPHSFIEYQRNGIIKADTVTYSHLYYIYNNREKKPSYQRLSSKVGYIYIETLKRDSIDFIMKKLKNTKGIIIDLRCYPYDSPGYQLGAYLMPLSTGFAKGTQTYFSDIGNFYFKDTLTIGKENKDYYKGKIVILVNEETQSSAEFHAMIFRVAPNAIVLGSTTSGADGNASYFWLPGGIQTLLTGIGIYYPDGTETQRIGIVPDIEVKPTIEGIKAGRDEVLEKAIELINLK